MARFEAAVGTPVEFCSPTAPGTAREPEQVAVECDGNVFVWHPGRIENDGERSCPTVTTVMGDGAEAGQAVNRFLSALSFALDQPMPVIVVSGTGNRGELDPPLLRQPYGTGSVTILLPAPRSIAIDDDPRLRLVLAVVREGRSAGSPFYRYLTIFNALTAAFRDNDADVNAYIDAHVNEPPPNEADGGFVWSAYLRDSLRNAVAHAVRRKPNLPVLDPDCLGDRAALDRSSRILSTLLRAKVDTEWPAAVQISY